MEFPEDLKYTKEHEWLRINGDSGTIGITDYAQGELGDIVFVELPPKGKQVKLGETFGTIEAVKAVSELYAPVTGEVIETNPDLEKTPEVINSDPYSKGWMLKIRLSNKGEVGQLLSAAQYRELVGK